MNYFCVKLQKKRKKETEKFQNKRKEKDLVICLELFASYQNMRLFF